MLGKRGRQEIPVEVKLAVVRRYRNGESLRSLEIETGYERVPDSELGKAGSLSVLPEPGNKKDKQAHVVKNNDLKAVGHVPCKISHCCFKFLQQGKITGVVTEKRRCNKDSPTGGLEISCLLIFEGTHGELQAVK